MRSSAFPIALLTVFTLVLAASAERLHGKQTGAPLADEQATSAQAGVPVRIVVTVQGHHGSELPNISAESVILNEGRARAKVTEWVPLQGDRAGLELFILLDDYMSTNQGTQLEDVRHFIVAQPATTKIGVAYMQQGGTKIVQSLTNDHSLASTTVIASVPFLQEDLLLFKLHGMEQSGLWLESQDITEELLKKLGLPAAQNTVVLFVPFAQIRCVFGNVDSPALSREAFGLEKP